MDHLKQITWQNINGSLQHTAALTSLINQLVNKQSTIYQT